MSIHLQSGASDLAIRLAGFLLLPIGVLAIRTLYRLIHTGPLHDSTAIELGLAALGFISLSLGSLLLALGSHIFDEVEISARWAPRYGSSQNRSLVRANYSPPANPVVESTEANTSAIVSMEHAR